MTLVTQKNITNKMKIIIRQGKAVTDNNVCATECDTETNVFVWGERKTLQEIYEIAGLPKRMENERLNKMIHENEEKGRGRPRVR